ncbi:hypothetical protein BaRGS_00009381 [Batillaria attramentaria]|uniref:C1q domain-containing protein n=1 Tax=Batillaria attramentaria TaxID=370345 RepID=A0ABD0LIS4_9CAEN
MATAKLQVTWGIFFLLCGFVSTMADNAPISRARRSDDTDPITPVVAQHSQELAELRAELSALKAVTESQKAELENVVCFTVRFSQADIAGLGQNQPIKFDVVQYDVGNGYEKGSGTFTAPVAGTYVFFLGLQRHGSDEETIILAIKKGDATIGVAEAGYSPYEHGSMLVTAHLERGDVISVQAVRGTTVFGGMSTSFSGFRISP